MSYPEFKNLIKVIKKLRDPQDGCPWDLEQTHQTLLPYLIEEAYEFIHATEENDPRKMEEEIGDVLLQVLLHCQIAEEKKIFTLETSSKVLADKLIRRHPHVFGELSNKISTSEIKSNWEMIKKEEKSGKEAKTLISKDILHLPSLQSAQKIGEKTHRIGFDWNDAADVYAVVQDELRELLHELDSETPCQEKIEEEFGDLLFSMAQWGRHLNIQSEQILYRANKKFLRRFQKMENLIENAGLDIHQMTQLEMDEYWKRVKAGEKSEQT